MFKRMVSIILCLIMAASAMITAGATNTQESSSAVNGSGDFSVLLAYTQQTTTALSINSSGTATSYAHIEGYSGTTTKVTITMYLQQESLLWWSNVASWTITVNSYSGTLNEACTGLDSDTYRVKAVYVAYSGSNSETSTGYSSEVDYN